MAYMRIFSSRRSSRKGLAAQLICEGREGKKLRLKLDSDDPEYFLYFGGSDVPMIEWKY